MRLDALQRLGHTVVGVDTTSSRGGMRSIWARIARKAGWAIDTAGANRAVLEVAKQRQLDVVWVDKGLTIRPQTLIRLRTMVPGVQLVHYSLDDMSGKHNQSRGYLGGIPLYDLHATNKSYNVAELREMGARAVLFVDNAFCPRSHHPVSMSKEQRRRLGGSVGFIGAFEQERAEAIWFLVTHGISVRVWGEGWGVGWRKWAASHRNAFLSVEDRAVFGEDYAKAICSFEINLCFLRKLNRDLQTTRSIEIPACGGFMLAERTAEHQRLLKEGAEVELFASHEELLAKCRYYLSHEEDRLRIAAAGHDRCLSSDYSYDRQLQKVLKQLEKRTTDEYWQPPSATCWV